jgi:type II secretory pathway pseudopilin PulG
VSPRLRRPSTGTTDGIDAARDHEHGFTVVELLVAMSLTMVIGTMLVLTFGQAVRAVVSADARGADAQVARVALDNTTKALRTAVDPDGMGDGVVDLKAFEVAAPEEVVFYAALGNRTAGVTADAPPVKVRIWRDGTVLRQSVTQPVTAASTTTWTGATTTRMVARDLVPAAVRPTFTYLAANDTAVDAAQRSISSLPVDGAGAVTTAARPDIGSVEVWVSVNSSVARNTPTSAVARVTLLNRE